MSQAVSVLLALVLGIATAISVSTWLPSVASEAATAANLVGTLWFNAIRMTVIPLVVSLLITSVVDAADGHLLSRFGKRAPACFLMLLLATAVGAAGMTSVALHLLPDMAGAMSEGASPSETNSASMPGNRVDLAQWLLTLIPANPFKSAVDGAMLPLIVFSIAFAVALHRVPIGARDALVNALRGVAEAMLIMLSWVIRLAPAGTFCLSFALVASAGTAVIGTLGTYVVLLCVVMVVATAALFGITAAFGGVPFQRFVDIIAPALTIAFTSRSSMAALPVLMRSVRERLAFSDAAAGLLLPFSASVLRVSVPASHIVAAMFVAHAFAIRFEGMQILTLIALTVMLSFAVPGVPNAGFVVMVPVFETLGLPTFTIGLLLAVDVIPDAFKTMFNVTGHFTAVTLIANTRGERHETIAGASAAKTA
jgi:Na+/H+-dicarboxylate symporter